MATNSSTLKRIEVKYIRDGIKSQYPKKYACDICDSPNDLENHHFFSVTKIWENWKNDTGVVINDADDIMLHRAEFYEAYRKELLEDVACLCNAHHKKLHTIYGAEPLLSTAEKQRRWVAIQREKLNAKITKQIG